MKITKQFIRRLEITEVPNLDPIRVMFEDIGPGQGRINIECYGQSWSAYWGSMGKDTTLAQFFCFCDEHYIAKNLSNIPAGVFDPDGLKDKLKREVIRERRVLGGTKREARKRWDAIEELDLPETEEQLWSIARQMEEIIGEEWLYSLPQKTNPDYEYLTRIIKAVQSALREVRS